MLGNNDFNGILAVISVSHSGIIFRAGQMLLVNGNNANGAV